MFYNFKYKLREEKGYTLIELLIIVSIISILSVVVIANQREGQRQFSVHRSAAKLAQDLRVAQNMAMVGKEFYSQFPQGGYGIYLVEGSDSYILFADCDGDKTYDGASLVCPDCTSGSCSSNILEEQVEEILLEVDVKILNLVPNSPLNIVFFPPDPIIDISGGSISANITLSVNGNSKNIYINNIGLIDID